MKKKDLVKYGPKAWLAFGIAYVCYKLTGRC